MIARYVWLRAITLCYVSLSNVLRAITLCVTWHYVAWQPLSRVIARYVVCSYATFSYVALRFNGGLYQLSTLYLQQGQGKKNWLTANQIENDVAD